MPKRKPGDPDVAFRGARFIKCGEFNKRMLIWWTSLGGYFNTDEQGFGYDDKRRVDEDVVRKALENA